MAKRKDTAITAADLTEYLSQDSDFSFELKMLRRLRAAGLQCEHGGLYEDPVTKKSREFDIRARVRHGAWCVHLTIECKNVRENYPLLVSCVPRHPHESFHEIAIVTDLARDLSGPYVAPALQARAKIVRIRGQQSLYKPGAPVGKSLAQVGRSEEKGEPIVASGAEIFDKWAQALASADELLSRAYAERYNDGFVLTWLLPIVVVPDGRLWIAQYDADGELSKPPIQVSHCSVFVDKLYTADGLADPALRVSHMNIMTLTGLLEFVADSLSSAEAMASIFPSKPIEAALG